MSPMTPTHSMPSSVDAVQNTVDRRHQEGEDPDEDADALHGPHGSVLLLVVDERVAAEVGRAERRDQAVVVGHRSSWTPGGACGWCRSNAGRSERIRGMLSKLCRGGGQDVAHSREAP